jgi:hypothetical protein
MARKGNYKLTSLSLDEDDVAMFLGDIYKSCSRSRPNMDISMLMSVQFYKMGIWPNRARVIL